MDKLDGQATCRHPQGGLLLVNNCGCVTYLLEGTFVFTQFLVMCVCMYICKAVFIADEMMIAL